MKGPRRREPGATRISPGHLCLGCERGDDRCSGQSSSRSNRASETRNIVAASGAAGRSRGKSLLSHTPNGRGNIDDTGPVAFRISAYIHGSPVCRSAIALFWPLVCRRPEVTALSAGQLPEWTSGWLRIHRSCYALTASPYFIFLPARKLGNMPSLPLSTLTTLSTRALCQFERGCCFITVFHDCCVPSILNEPIFEAS